MIDESTQENAALYALDLLEGPEREAFARRVQAEPELAALVDELRNSSAQLAAMLPQHEPPARLRAKLLAAARAEGQEPSAAAPGRVLAMPRRSAWLTWASPALAAGLLLLGVLALRLLYDDGGDPDLKAELERAQNEIRLQDVRIASLSESLAKANEKVDLLNVRLATLTAPDSASGLAALAWDTESQKGVLRVSKLPQTTGSAVYQLWAIGDKSGVPVSAGIFTVSADGSTIYQFEPETAVPDDIATFAVSLEQARGHTAPEGPIVLSGRM